MSSAIASLRSTIRIGPRRASHKRGSQPVEYQLMLTATMCLLAFGVVMVRVRWVMRCPRLILGVVALRCR